MSLKVKSLITLFTLSIVPIILTLSVIFYSNHLYYVTQQKASSQSAVSNMTGSIDDNFDRIEKLSDSLLFQSTSENENLLTIFRRESGTSGISDNEKLLNDRVLAQLVDNIAYANDTIEGVFLFTNQHIYFETQHMDLYFDDTARQSSWYQQAIQSHGKLTVCLPKGYGSSNIQYIGIVREVVDPVSVQGVGVMVILCNAQIFRSIQDNRQPGSEICVADPAGNRIYGSDWTRLGSGEINPELENSVKGKSQGYLYNRKLQKYISYATLHYNGWKLILESSAEAYNANLQGSFEFSSFMVLACGVLSIALTILLTRMFTDPIIRLSGLIGENRLDKISEDRKLLSRRDEIGSLYQQFQKMIQEINTLIQEKYINHIALLDSRLKALSSQINSHFIFNTLESINSLAAIEGNRRIQIMVTSLGNMIRYAIDLDSDVVFLSDELSQVESFIDIQNIRMGRKIFVQYRVPEAMKQEKVLKFIMQPLVENAIRHGLRGLDRQWNIRIEAGYFGKLLKLSVWDNGKGINPEKLLEIRKMLRSGETKESTGEKGKFSSGIGLKNIDTRIKLMYGSSYGLDISSVEGSGTEVVLLIPKRTDV